MTTTPAPVAVRLSPDALYLEVLLAPDAMAIPVEALAALIREHSNRLDVTIPLTPHDVETLLRSRRGGRWMTLLSGTAPTPPVDGRVELLVPVPVSTAGRTRCAVRAGTPLARLRHGTPGRPGCDLLGRDIPPRPPRVAHLPQGPNTTVDDDGLVLFAAHDGEIVLRQLLIHVVPMRVHDGDLDRHAGPLVAPGPVFVTGTVREGGRIEAAGDVYVGGDVWQAQVESKDGSVAVAGIVTGTVEQPATLRATSDVSCGNALHARVEAGGDVRLLAEARHSAVRAGGSMYLQRSLDRGLFDVHLDIAGGLLPVLDPPTGLAPLPTDRQHFRVATRLDAQIALHGPAPLAFYPCTIVDVSTGGARCQLPTPLAGEAGSPGAVMQLKFALRPGDEPLLAIAHLSRPIAPGVVGLAFLQMTGQDHDRLTAFCLGLLLERGGSGKLATRNDRAG